MSESPECHRSEHRQHPAHRCLPPPTHTPHSWGRGTSSSEGARRHLSSWYPGAGLGVVCLVLLSFLSFSARGHGRDSQAYLFAVSGISQGLEGGREAPHGLYELTGLTVWRLYFCDWRHPGQAFLAGLQSRVQVTWSRKMPVGHPHRRWWTWWTWRDDTVCLCRSLGVTHIRPFKLLFTHISHKWVGRSSVMGICFACHSGPLQHRRTHTCMHTHAYTHVCMHTQIHTCMHMHMGMHTPLTYNTQSRFRGWELLVSQCANCFSLLSPWISQQESDVSIV